MFEDLSRAVDFFEIVVDRSDQSEQERPPVDFLLVSQEFLKIVDVVVIGGGPGGYAAALYGASAGLDIAIIENNARGVRSKYYQPGPFSRFEKAESVYIEWIVKELTRP